MSSANSPLFRGGGSPIQAFGHCLEGPALATNSLRSKTKEVYFPSAGGPNRRFPLESAMLTTANI